MSKFPLLKKSWTESIEATLEGDVVSRKIRDRNVSPIMPPLSIKEAATIWEQKTAALIYYGNIMEIPYSESIGCSITHPLYEQIASILSSDGGLYEYFSKAKLLKGGKRPERQRIWEEVKHLFNFETGECNYRAIQNILKNKIVPTSVAVDAEELEMGEENNEVD